MEEDFRVKYIKGINNVLSKHKDLSDEDRAILNQCVGYIYTEIRFDGKMTNELAKELDCECLWKDEENV